MTQQTHTPYALEVLARIDAVLADEKDEYSLDENARKLLRVLACHVGKDAAISRGELGHYLALPDRAVRAMIHDLREGLGIAIGSSRTPRASGYYIIASAAETQELTALLHSQAQSLIRTAKALTAASTALQIDQEIPRAA